MYRSMLLFGIVFFQMTLEAASPEPIRRREIPKREPSLDSSCVFHIRPSDGYISQSGITHDHNETEDPFHLFFFPKENPIWVFAYKCPLSKAPVKVRGLYNEKIPSLEDQVSVKTAFSAVDLEGSFIFLHLQSGHHKNLKKVQEEFLKPFLIKGLSSEEFGSVLLEQQRAISKDLKLYEELACELDRTTSKGKKAFQMVSAIRQADDFVTGHICYLTLDRNGRMERSEYAFGLPWRAVDKKDPFSKFFQLVEVSCYNFPIMSFGLDTEGMKKTLEKKDLVLRNINKLGLELAAYKYSLEIKDHIIPGSEASFVIFDTDRMNLSSEEYHQALETRRAQIREDQEIFKEEVRRALAARFGYDGFSREVEEEDLDV